jgi:cell division protein YceG involved in septum cleavage
MSDSGGDLSVQGRHARVSLAWIATGVVALLTTALGIVWHRAEEIEANLSKRIGDNHTEAQVKDGEHDRSIGELQRNQAAASVITAAQLSKDVQEIKVKVTEMNTRLEDLRERNRRER